MEKLFWIISLSLIIGCGKERPPNEDYGLLSYQQEAMNGASWPIIKLQGARILQGPFEVGKTTYQTENEKFYEDFKGQYKNNGFAIQMPPLGGRVELQIDDPKLSLVGLDFLGTAEAKNLRLSVSQKEGPGQKLYFELENIDATTLRIDFSKISERPFTAVITLEDFSFNQNKGLVQASALRKTMERSHYRLHIDDGVEREMFYLPVGTSIEESFRHIGVEHKIEGNRVLSLKKKRGLEWGLDLNKLEDHASFWTLINTPDQNATYRPVAGQDILVKNVGLEEMRKEVAKTVIKTLRLSSPVIPAAESADVFKREILTIAPFVLIPKITKTKLDKTCKYKLFGDSKIDIPYSEIIYELGHERKKIKFDSKKITSPLTSALTLDDAKPSITLSIGSRFEGKKHCKRKSYKLIKKKVPYRYDITVTMKVTYKL